jgi:hypothetical protein
MAISIIKRDQTVRQLIPLRSITKQGVSKTALQCYSKRYCVASVIKKFTPKGVQTIP